MNAIRKFSRKACLCLSVVMAFAWTQAAHADPGWYPARSLLGSTHLIEITQDTYLSSKKRGLRHGGFETSGGSWVGFDQWYGTDWNDTRVSWITQVNQSAGVIWGLSTGEKAKKYAIDPGFRIGFLFQTQLGKRASLSLTGSTVVGGKLREKACMADYGDIGGIQVVNCRLAASTLAPSETLKYLYNEKPDSSVQLRYRLMFF